MIVFDAGALIALINLEPGAVVTRRLLRHHKGGCCIHAVNLLEIYYGFERMKDAAYAERILDLLAKAGVATRGDFDRDFLKDASHLKTLYKMSLADTFAVALARRLGVELISTDHHELDALAVAGVCRITFIR